MTQTSVNADGEGQSGYDEGAPGPGAPTPLTALEVRNLPDLYL